MEYRPQPLLNQVLGVGIKAYLLAGNRQMRTVLQELKMPFDYEEVDGVEHDPRRLCQKVGLKGYQFNARAFQAAAERPVD